MMLDKNTKAMVLSPDGDTDFFDFVTGVLQRRYINIVLVNTLPI